MKALNFFKKVEQKHQKMKIKIYFASLKEILI